MSEKPLLEMIGIDKTFGRQTRSRTALLRCSAGKPWS